MDFSKLLKGKSVADAYKIADNWYFRLNKLKDKYGEPISGIGNEKASKLIYCLIERLMIISIAIRRAESQRLKPNYKKG